MHPSDTASNSSSSASTLTPFLRVGERLPRITEQISNFAHLDTFLSIEDLPRITVKGKQYVQEEHINKGRLNSKRWSWIGQHGVYLVQMDGNIKEETFWSCNLCDKPRDSLLYKTGTSGNSERHLKQKHDIKNPRDHLQTPSSSSGEIRSMLGVKRQKIDNIPTMSDAANLFKLTLIRWIVKANISLTAPEDAKFYSLIDLASLGSNHLVDLVPTGNPIRTGILKEFDDRRQEIKPTIVRRCAGQSASPF